MDRVFGSVYAKSLASDLTMSSLGGRTAAEALAAGVAPREVWDAVCAAMDVPEPKRWAHLDARPRRR
jgi:hypothetical protein